MTTKDLLETEKSSEGFECLLEDTTIHFYSEHCGSSKDPSSKYSSTHSSSKQYLSSKHSTGKYSSTHSSEEDSSRHSFALEIVDESQRTHQTEEEIMCDPLLEETSFHDDSSDYKRTKEHSKTLESKIESQEPSILAEPLEDEDSSFYSESGHSRQISQNLWLSNHSRKKNKQKQHYEKNSTGCDSDDLWLSSHHSIDSNPNQKRPKDAQNNGESMYSRILPQHPFDSTDDDATLVSSFMGLSESKHSESNSATVPSSFEYSSTKEPPPRSLRILNEDDFETKSIDLTGTTVSIDDTRRGDLYYSPDRSSLTKHFQSHHSDRLRNRPSSKAKLFHKQLDKQPNSDRSLDLPVIRIPNKNGVRKFASSLDLIYGHGEATPYFTSGPIGVHNETEDVDGQTLPSLGTFHKNPIEMKALRIEAFFYNRGMEIAMGVLFLALNYLVAAHAAYQFTEAGGYTTENDLLRWTMPVARGGGRLVTLNCAILLLTGCKYLWTLVRTYVAPVIPIGFPIDDVMPKYHRYVALTVIVAGCVIHALPQLVNYASKAIPMDHDGLRGWTFGNGLASKQLLITGSLLTVIFVTFFLTTLNAFRKTAAGFRWFWFFHVGGIVLAYPMLILHGTYKGHPVFFYAALAPLLLYLFDISMRRRNISTAHVLRWKIHQHQEQEITELVVECPPKFFYTPGQYVDLKFQPISSREWHPFTIASAPNENTKRKDGKRELVFYIKNSGRWTGALCDYASAFDLAKARKPPKIHMRGPYGAPATNYFEYKHIIVIGSGVGVAPLLSIWKYLVAGGRAMVHGKKRDYRSSATSTTHKSVMDASRNVLITRQNIDLNGSDEDISFAESLELENARTKSTIRADCIFLKTILESMTVSLILFAVFVLGETFTIVLQIFGCVEVASMIAYTLSTIALLVYGTTILVSTVALGCCSYFRHFKCWLECCIVLVDIFALWFSTLSNLEDPILSASRHDTIVYFCTFGCVVLLHAIRIFHMFYVTLKPAILTKADKINNPSVAKKSYGSICSVRGILINRKYSSMRFAAKDLLPPILGGELSNLFSMEFYGTREKDTQDDEESLIHEMIHSKRGNSGIRSSILYDDEKKFLCAGRPDWNSIFLKAIASAHCTNPEGETVGIFFCGSPAIAKDLQAEAKKVTAQHQFAMKHLHGKACKCKLIVHSESF